MSAPMKKLRTESIEIVVRGSKERKFLVPSAQMRPVLTLLKQFENLGVEKSTEKNEGFVPWEELAEARIKKFSKPGLALRGARAKEGLTQVELAEKVGIPQYNLSKMETGARPIGKKLALRLAKVLRVDYRIFL